MKRNNLLLTAALAVILAATTACGGSSGSAAAPSSAPGTSALPAGGPMVTITMWHGLGGTGGTALQAEVDAFNAANAGKIKLESIFQGSYADTLAKYTSAIRDKSTPSILVTNDITTGFVYDAGQTVSAQSMAAANPGDLNLQQLRPAARNYYSANGKLLAVPLATSMPLLYVNTAMLAKANMQLSTLSTLAGVAAAARAVHAASPSVAGIVQPFDGWWFEQLTAGAGQPYCTPDNGRTGGGATAFSLTSTAQKSAFGAMASLYVDGVGLNTGTDGNAALTAFSAGKVAMMLNSSGAIGGLSKAGMKGYQALPYPISGPAATSGAVIGGAAMWVDGPGHSPAEQVASWKAISFLASAQAQERFSQASGYAPINTAVDSSPTEKTFLAAHPSYAVLSKQFAATPATTATAGCLSGAMTAIRTSVVTQMQSAFSGATSLNAALTTAQSPEPRQQQDHRLPQAGRQVTHPATGAPADPYRYGVYLRPDPHTCLAVTTITGQLRAQYGLVSAGSFPPHATLIGSQHITAEPRRIIDALTPALADRAPFPVFNNGVQRQGIGFVYNVHFLADGRTANPDLIDLARTVDRAVAPLVTPAPSPHPGHVFDPATFEGHLSLASHDLYQRPDLHAELEEYLHGLPVTHPATFTAENVSLYRTHSRDWTGRWWQTLSWEHIHTWRLQ